MLFFDSTAAAADGRALFREVARFRGEAVAGKSSSVGRLVARALKVYPELEDLGYENFSSAWHRGNYFLVHLPFPDGGKYLAPLTAMAHRFGLTTYDPQTDPEARRYLAAWD